MMKISDGPIQLIATFWVNTELKPALINAKMNTKNPMIDLGN